MARPRSRAEDPGLGIAAVREIAPDASARARLGTAQSIDVFRARHSPAKIRARSANR